MESRIIGQRTFRFAIRITKLCELLRKRGWTGRKIADQLFDSGTSIGANCAESQGGQTKRDFTARLAIARKESWETVFWLKLAAATAVTTNDQIAWELDEARQLRAMITQAVKTAQASSSRGGNPPNDRNDGVDPDV
jgi:four helix bundle protein